PEKEGDRFTSRSQIPLDAGRIKLCMDKHAKCRTSASQQVPDAPSEDFETRSGRGHKHASI
ncbi:hypothetical protein EMPG_12826, partial [Blastomyces silverae]